MNVNVYVGFRGKCKLNKYFILMMCIYIHDHVTIIWRNTSQTQVYMIKDTRP